MSLLNSLRFIATHPLGRHDRFGALLRFVRWQVGSRLLPGPIVCAWVNGTRFMASSGDTGMTGNIYVGLHEFTDMAFVLHFLRRGDLFVDVGANAGSYTILACAAAGARGIALEPAPDAFRKLVDNVRLNALEDSVACLNVCVGRTEGRAYMTSDRDTTNHVLATDELRSSAIGVDMTTLDAVLHDESPLLMKIDVEGFEWPVLEGAFATLESQLLQAVIMETNGSGRRYGFADERVIGLMRDAGFTPCSYDPRQRALSNQRHADQPAGNTLFIRDRSFVYDRLTGAPAIQVHGATL